MIPDEWLDEAATRIAPYIQRTPLTFDAARNLYLKWENHQVTGSFKARGALNKVLALEEWEREAGLVTASAGNHGQGVALAGKLTRAPVTCFVSEDAVPTKVEAIRSLGAHIETVPGGYHEAEAAGIRYAAEHGQTWVSAYNDGHVIAGQGTLALEVLTERPETARATWLVPVSGGGLIAGIGVALARLSPKPPLLGVQAEASAFMHSMYYRNTQEGVPDLPTLADGLAGAIEENAVTIPMVRRLVDDILLVSEEEIAQAIAFAWHTYGEKIEGAGAVGLAAILSGKVTARPAVVIVSGGNIQPEVHARIVQRPGGGG
ncbi:MAG: threonine/serine dehydratase [Anaerolineae bacterium]|nr:MAG: threonine/serine dehydratase [Anaerolineae bacterium]